MASLSRLPQQNAASPDDMRLLIRSVQDYAIFMLDLEGRVVSWNLGAEKLKGYTEEEIVGQHVSKFYPPELVDQTAAELAEAREKGRWEGEGWRIRKDGTRFWANAVITALYDEQRMLRGFAEVTRDETAHRATEEALRRSEERQRLMIEAVSDYAIYMLDPNGIVTSWNSGAQKIKGYTPQEVIGKSFAQFFPPSDIAAGRPRALLQRATHEGGYQEEAYRVRKNGEHFWASVMVTPVKSASGELLGFAKVTRDLTERVKAEQTAIELAREQAARTAAEAGEALLRESEQRYRQVSTQLHVILEGVGDGISVQDRSGRVIFANTAAARASGFSSVEELLRTPSQEVVGRFELMNEHDEPIDLNLLPGRRVLRGEPPCSMVMHVRDRATGRDWWPLVRSTSVLGADGKPELAINIWHDVSEARQREKNEKSLAQATATLSESLDYVATLEALAKLLVPDLADWCAIDLLDGSELRSVAVAHSDPHKIELAHTVRRRYPPDPAQPHGLWQVLKSGTPELYETIPDALLTRAAHDDEHLRILREVGMRSVIIVPIRMQNRIQGALTLIYAESGRSYRQQDVALAEELGRRAGSAIENARLYAAERKARAQLSLLARAGELFSSASDYEHILRGVVDVALPTLADFAFFDVVEGSAVRRIAAAHQDAEVHALLSQTRWQRSTRQDKNLCALSSGKSGFHPHIDDAFRQDVATSPEHLALLEQLQLRSMITVPLHARDELLGSLTLCYGKSGRAHTREELELAEELARRAAIAITQVRLYERAQEAARSAEQAAKRAEEANRVKDEFLATVSHELRTPLTAILGWSSVLRGRSNDAAVTKAIEVIHRNAMAQGKIIEDILDVSRIITGKLRLDLKAIDLMAVVRDAIEVIRPSAVAKHLTIHVIETNDDCTLVADPERLGQIAWNLLSNAVKFTEAGGRIDVGVQRQGSQLVLIVEDTGRGIEREFLPFVFDRFKQADSSATRRFGGLGLGLAIVRHLVELHGGLVEADSAGIGHGARFTVTLPIRAVLPKTEADAFRAPAAENQLPSELQGNALANKRVLVVDDEADARDLLQTVLSSAGAIVATAASASEGLTLIRRFRPHVLVSDIGMPDEDGYSFMRRVRALAPELGGNIPSVALTAYTRAEDKVRALAMGFSTHVSKPVDAQHLLNAVANLASLVRS